MLRVAFEDSTFALVCHLMGNLEQGTAGQFREAIAQPTDKREVIFELSAVPFVDSAGLGALIGTIRRIHENGGDSVVCGARPSVSKVFQIIGLHRIVTIVDNVDQARDALRGRYQDPPDGVACLGASSDFTPPG